MQMSTHEWLHPIPQLILQKNEAVFMVNYDLQKTEIKDQDQLKRSPLVIFIAQMFDHQ